MNASVPAMGLMFGAAIASQAAYGQTVAYQVNDPGNAAQSRFRQQAGPANYSYGDDANFGALAGSPLQTVKMRFALYTYDFQYGTGTYAPTLQLQLYTIDPITKLPVDQDLITPGIQAAPFATAIQNNAGAQVLTGSNSPSGNFTEIFTDGSFQEFTFDFTSQNILVPAEVGFAYHDLGGDPSNPAYGGPISGGLAVLMSTVGPVVGTSNTDAFFSAPNDANNDVFQPEGSAALGRYLVATITVPEPASLLLLGAGSLFMFRRRTQRS